MTDITPEAAAGSAANKPAALIVDNITEVGADADVAFFDKTVQCLGESLRIDPGWDGQALNWLLLAMAQQKLNECKEAKHCVEAAEKELSVHPFLFTDGRIGCSLDLHER